MDLLIHHHVYHHQVYHHQVHRHQVDHHGNDVAMALPHLLKEVSHYVQCDG